MNIGRVGTRPRGNKAGRGGSGEQASALPRRPQGGGRGLGDRPCPRPALTPHSADRSELWLSSRAALVR